jgi:hypothetical protein
MWDVDIISMSFGFSFAVTSIEQAIKRANDKEIILLATASHPGDNSDLAWPARMPEVISIYATDSYGNKCIFIPNPISHAYNFSVPGQAVKSCWPTSLESSGEMRRSGTSIATPIAAGIVAITLAYVISLLSIRGDEIGLTDLETFKKIRTSSGMSTVLNQMVTEQRNGYDYIVPWHFFGPPGYPNPDITIPNIILRELRRRN